MAAAAVLVGTLAMTMPAGAGTSRPESKPGSDTKDSPPADRGAQAEEQWRSYWADSFNTGYKTPAQVDKLVADAEAVGANALIVQVGRNMDCFCNDASFPRTDDPAVDPAPFDPLRDVVQKAHAAGIEVHAWVNATIFWRTEQAPQDPDHVFHSHGPDATGEDRWLNKREDGTEAVDGIRYFLDPANPAATDYFTDGVASLLENYDIDGINLDYIRYPDYNSDETRSEWGYSETSIARFQEATGRTDIPEPGDQEFSDWRRDQVTSFVRKIYLRMYELKPAARLSINGITYGNGPQATEGGYQSTRTYANVLQDWKGWLSEGIVDTVITMNYKRQHDAAQSEMFAEWNEFTADNQAERSAVTGPGIYLNSVQSSLEQAAVALSPTAAGNQVIGWSGYAYATPSMDAADDPGLADDERTALADGLRADLFAEPATVPEMPWKSEPSAGHLRATLQLDDGTALDQVRVTAIDPSTGEQATTRTDGTGQAGFVDLAPGRYRVEVELPDHVVGPRSTTVRVTAGELAEAGFDSFQQP